MIEGLLRHCTDTDIEANYVDTHGASVVGFASPSPSCSGSGCCRG
jgi:TnpA family transposase